MTRGEMTVQIKHFTHVPVVKMWNYGLWI